MFGIGETELVIIVVFAFLLFGPDKLPGMGRTLGRVLRQFREASDGFTEVVQTNIMDPASEELEKSPKQRQREAAEAFEEDADREDAASEEIAPRRESFAERRARLKAEREAAEASEATVPEDDASKPTTSEAADQSQDEAVESADETRTSAASLYAMSSRKSSRTLEAEAKAQAKTEEEQAAIEPPASGEEDGSDEA